MVAMSGFGYGYVHPRVKASDVVPAPTYASMTTDSDGVITIENGPLADVSLREMVILTNASAANITSGSNVRLNSSTVTGQSLSGGQTIMVNSTVGTAYAEGGIDMSGACKVVTLAAADGTFTITDAGECEYAYSTGTLEVNKSAIVRRGECEGLATLNSSVTVSNASIKSSGAIEANAGDYSDGGLLEAASAIYVNGGSFATVRSKTVIVAAGASVAFADAETLVIYTGAAVATGKCNVCVDGDSGALISPVPSGITSTYVDGTGEYTPTIEGFDALTIPNANT